MSILSKMTSLLGADQPLSWATVMEKGQEALDVAKSHPWTTLGVTTGTLVLWNLLRAPRNLPPGPRGIPFIGATQSFDYLALPAKLFEWRKTYGEVISYKRLGCLYVVLNSERMIKEAFVKKADAFSDRDHASYAFIMSDGKADEVFSADYNDQQKQHKKFAASSLKDYGFGTARSEKKINENSVYLEEFLMQTGCAPIDVTGELKLFASAVMCSMVLGMDVTRNDPEPAELITHFDNWYNMLFAVMVAHGVLGQVSPRLASLLNSGVEKEHTTAKANLRDYVGKKILEVAKDIDEREPRSVCDAYLKARGTSPAAVEMIASNFMAFMADGLVTIPTLQINCLQYLTFNPDLQERLFKEINSVIGTSRPATLNDRGNMPFIQAVIYETIRLSLPLHLSLPKVVKTDAVLDGYNIPKGTIVQGNFYGVHFDPEIFPDPQAFNPDRFIGDDGKFNHNLASKLMTFGTGPRMCLGHGYFKMTTFFTIARLIQQYKIQFDPNAEELQKATLENSYALTFGMENKLCFIPR